MKCLFFILYLICVSSQPATDKLPSTIHLINIPAAEYKVGKKGHFFNPVRKVKLSAYQISETEVTNAQFAEFISATNYVTDAERNGYGKTFQEGMIDWEWEETQGADWRHPFGPNKPGYETMLDYPVTQISGADADSFCRWAGCRLPTVDEWEVAARAGANDAYPWGKKLYKQGKACANIWEGDTHRKNKLKDGYMYLSPVKSFPPNAWGLYDVIGNVFEYCSNQPPGMVPDTAHIFTTARGGSWWCSAGTCNYYNLYSIGRMYRHASFANQGFRVVRTVLTAN